MGEEIPAAVERLSQAEEFLALFSHLTRVDKDKIQKQLEGITTRKEFQERFFGPTMKRLIAGTTDGVTATGLEYIEPGKSYLFVSNHRDIILDSAILNVLLSDQGCHYCEAAIGSNLLINKWVTDLVKLDACFIIERGLPVRDMITSANMRSHYLRDVILENQDSVWIAQKEGRTKNGDDRTQHSLLKMFRMSGPKDFVENFRELRVVPVSISYEWEPCDDLKTDELYQKTVGEYIKTPAADMRSMQQGLSGYKGRVHFAITPPIDRELEEIDTRDNNGDRITDLANFIDSRIQGNFRLWENNYIAYDLLHGTNKFTSKYTEKEKENFIRVMTEKMDKLEGNRSVLNNIFLEIYANPVKNALERHLCE
jgi:hypothetical protein